MMQNSDSYMDCELDFDNELHEDHYSSEITQFFAGKNVLVTGGSGFLGKLIVEKLLRCCPDIATLFMLMRPKKGISPEERLRKQFENVLYDRLKKECPNFFSKIVMIQGDIGVENLDLSEESRKVLSSANIIIHAAATVRFDESLRVATNVNVRSVRDLLIIAKQMPNLEAFVHVSTAFSQCVLKCIEEKYYKPSIDPEKLIKLTEILDDEKLDVIQPALLGKWPNTYTFTKAVAEDMVREYSVGVPTCIVRPSIVIATSVEPVTAWIDNLYGPTGVVVGAAMGLLRTLHCAPHKKADIIPADYVISSIIAATWETGVNRKNQVAIEDSDTGVVSMSDIERTPIYNVVSSCQQPIYWGDFMTYNAVNGLRIPSDKVLWYYWFGLTESYPVHKISRIVFHLLPALIIDAVACAVGRKPMLWKAYKKIHKFCDVISYFCSQEWRFNNDATLALLNKLNPIDRKVFNFDLKTLDWDVYFHNHMAGLRVYLLGDPMHTLELGRKKYRKLKIAHYSMLTVFYLLAFWFITSFLLFLWSIWPLSNS